MLSDNVLTVPNIGSLFEIDKLLLIVFSFMLMILFVKILQRVSKNLQKKFHHYRLYILQFVTIISFFLYIFGSFFIIYVIIAPPRELLIALGGSIAVAVGFSLKDLVSSFMAGLVLLFDRPFQVGDRVTFDKIYGEIVSIGLRAVRIHTLTDDLVTIPNNRFLSDIVQSGNAGELTMMIATDFYIAIDADVDKAVELLYEIVATSRFVYMKKRILISLTEIVDYGNLLLQLKVKAYVLDVQYEKQFQTDIVSRCELLFKMNKIKRK